MDAYSRYLVACRALRRPHAIRVRRAFEAIFDEFGLPAQQRAFGRFRVEYNHERPHEALGQRPPADFYQPSRRPLPVPLWGRDFSYPDAFEVVRANKQGNRRWCGRTVFLSSALRHELLGLDPVEADAWEVYFGSVALGRIERPPRGRFGLRFVRSP